MCCTSRSLTAARAQPVEGGGSEWEDGGVSVIVQTTVDSGTFLAFLGGGFCDILLYSCRHGATQTADEARRHFSRGLLGNRQTNCGISGHGGREESQVLTTRLQSAPAEAFRCRLEILGVSPPLMPSSKMVLGERRFRRLVDCFFKVVETWLVETWGQEQLWILCCSFWRPSIKMFRGRRQLWVCI